jgi:DNA polymerase III subunit gamma/tau
MSYIVFARKWRPMTFADVVGQSHITDTLKKAIEKKRIAHAYIFSGTRGVGKTTTARILARALNCEQGPTPEPCGKCDSCKGIASGSSFDVLEIDGASNNGVEDIRQLRENVGYSSMGGKYRIYVIDEVHMLSKSAFNALLKTLEEPPPNVIFIFATTEPQKIPATIHSRCQRYDFRRIMPEQICERLSFICKEEHIEAEKNALSLIASKAEGSMRDALSLLDQACSYSQGKLTERETRLVLGIVNIEVYARIMNAIAAKTPAPVLEAVQQVLYEGYDLHEFVAGFEEYMRTMMFARIGGGIANSAGSAPRLLEHFSEGDFLRMMEIIRRAENDLKWSAYPRFAAEMMLLKLVFLDSTVTLERMLVMLDGADEGKKNDVPAVGTKPALCSGSGELQDTDFKKKTELAVTVGQSEPGVKELDARNSVAKAMAAASKEDEAGEDNFDDRPSAGDSGSISDRWHEFIEKIMHDRPHIGTFLALATVAGHTDSSIDLVFEQNFAFQFGEVNKKQHREEIAKMMHSFIGRTIEVNMTLDAKRKEKPEIKHDKPEAHAMAIESEIAREPVIGTVLDIFDGEVLK